MLEQQRQRREKMDEFGDKAIAWAQAVHGDRFEGCSDCVAGKVLCCSVPGIEVLSAPFLEMSNEQPQALHCISTCRRSCTLPSNESLNEVGRSGLATMHIKKPRPVWLFELEFTAEQDRLTNIHIMHVMR